MTSIRSLADLYGDDPEDREALFDAARRRLSSWRARLRTCSVCGEEKPADAFGPDLRNVDGLESRCRACEASRTAASRTAGPLLPRQPLKASPPDS